MLTLSWPWIFILLPLPLLVRWLVPAFRDSRSAVRVPFFETLQQSTGAKPESGTIIRSRRSWQTLVFILCWIAILTALARPQYIEDPVYRELPTRDLLLAIDLSGSMEARDFTNAEGENVDRLTAVKEVLNDFLTRRRGDRVGMIVFGNAAFVQVPFTQDLEVCRQLLNETAIRMAGPKTALGDAIGLGINLFERSEIDNQVMIVLTDGNDTGSRIPPAEAARIAASRNVVVHTVAMGNPEAVGEEKLDEEALEAVADITGGRYFFGADTESLESIYEELDKLSTHEVDTLSHRPKRDLYAWPLGFVLILTLLAQGNRVIRRRIAQSSHPMEVAA